MIRVENKKILRSLALREYRTNPGRNLLTILAVFLTTLLLTVICSLGISYYEANDQRNIRTEGMDYDVTLPEPDQEQIDRARQLPQVVYAGANVKCDIIREAGQRSTEVRLFWADEVNWEKQCLPAYEFFEGSYPQAEDEIVLSTASLNELGIEEPRTGMEISVYTDALGQRTFRLCGWYRDYSSHSDGYISAAYRDLTGSKLTDDYDGKLYITLKWPIYTDQFLDDLMDGIGMREGQMLYAQYGMFKEFLRLAAGVLLLLALVLVSGYLFIYNVLYISVTRRVRYYGKMKTLGMTSVQLRRYVWRQVWINAAAGIPLGLLCGSVIAVNIVPGLLEAVAPMAGSGSSVEFLPAILAAAAVFSLFTVISGTRKPAAIAGELSPIDAVRYTGAAGRRTKSRKTVNGAKLSRMAFWNMFRDKKQACVILASFLVSMSAFLCVSVLVEGNGAKKTLDAEYSYDIRLSNGKIFEEPDDKLSREVIEKIRSLDQVAEVRVVKSLPIAIPNTDGILNSYYKTLYEDSRLALVDYESDMELYAEDPLNIQFTGRLLGLDEAAFDWLNETMGGTLDKEAFLAGELALIETAADIPCDFVGEALTFQVLESAGEGELFTYRAVPGEVHTVMPAAQSTADLHPYSVGLGPGILVSQAYLDELSVPALTESVDVIYKNSYDQATEDAVLDAVSGISGLSYQSKLDRYGELKQSENQMKTLGYALCLIMGGLALLNFANMMAVGIQNRRREFAVLESIGMTGAQIRRMLLMEGGGYVVLAGLGAAAFGIPLSRWLFDGMITTSVEFAVPLFPNLVMGGALLVCCMGIPIVMYRLIRDRSIVEQLRKD